MRTLTFLTLLTLLLTVSSKAAHAGSSDNTTDEASSVIKGTASFNRTTLVVRDMNASLAFWRDVMNFDVHTQPRKLPPQENKYLGWSEETTEVRFARVLSPQGAGVGLLEIKDEGFPSLNIKETPAAYGGVVLVFVARDIEALYERAVRANAVFKPLSLSPTGLSQQTYLRSPSGHVLEIFELIAKN